jgi:hypothetical protein
LLLAGVLSAAGCDDAESIVSTPSLVVNGNGHVVEEPRALGGCTSVDLNGVGVLYIRQGAREELYIRAEENLLEYLKTDVQAGRLLIWKDFVTLLNTRPIEYHLTVVDLQRVALSGAGRIQGSDLDTGSLALSLSGAGSVELVNLNASGLDVDVSGVGGAILSGSVQEQTIRLRSMGNYNGRDLDSADAEVLIGSLGSATVRVRDRLNATIDSAGFVYYIGDPVVSSDIRGSGEVVRIEG